MLADLPKPFLFIHIPKTAGTSIENALIPTACGERSLEDMDTAKKTLHALPGGSRTPIHRLPVAPTAVQHECVAYFDELGQLAHREVIAAVRNPYDRALSEIFYLLRANRRAAELFHGPTWADDLKAFAAFDGVLNHDLKACQIDWLTDRTGKIRCDRIIRFETLAEDWGKLCTDWGLENKPLPHHHNSGRKLPWWEYYNGEAAAAIAHKYAKDFDLLGYDKALPQTNRQTVENRSVWIGQGTPTGDDIQVPYKLRHHGRLELPDHSAGTVRIHRALELLNPAERIALLAGCKRLLTPTGKLFVHTNLDQTLVNDTLEFVGLALNPLIPIPRQTGGENIVAAKLPTQAPDLG